MKRGLLLCSALILVVGLIPIASADEHEETDDPDCITPPDVEPDYEWAYEMSNDRTRYVEVVDEGPATTPRGHQNVTTLEFYEENDDGESKAWGQLVRYAPNSSYPWGLTTQDRWEKTEKGEVRRMDSYDPPFMTIHHGSETCPGDRWRFTTHHTIQYGQYGQQGNDEANETWQVRALAWENVSVPEGTYEALPVTAVREADRYTITTYWSPEVRAPVMTEQGPAGTTELTRELTWYILDQRPTPIFQVLPQHPEVGDELTLNGTASWDPEGNITEYRWLVDGETYHGANVTVNATEEGTVDIRLFVTDEANRTSTLGTTRYIAPADGTGVGISGPTKAYRGQVVTLEAHPSFDPIDVRWRDNTTVVGNGDRFQFRAQETRNLSVDAFHESGRVFTANHTVEVLDRETADGSGEGPGEDSDRYPPGGSDELAILEPLEGQIVPPTFEVTVRAKASATLTAGERPVWQGTAEPSQTVTVELQPGEHTLTLDSADGNQTVNVTVATEGQRSLDGGDAAGEAQNGSGTTSPVPGPSLWLATVSAGLAALARRRGR